MKNNETDKTEKFEKESAVSFYKKEDIKNMTLSQRISCITEEVGPIAKTKRPGDTVAFKYRSIDDVQNRLNPLLSWFGVTVQSKILKIETSVREFEKSYNNVVTKKIAYTAIVHMAYIFSDGVTTETWEEAAMSEDFADKAVTQATSMAYKYALVRKFCIPTEDIGDPDSREPDYRDTSREESSGLPRPTAWLNENTPEWEEVEQKLLSGEWKVSDVKARWKTNKKQDGPLHSLEEKGQKEPKKFDKPATNAKQEPVKEEKKATPTPAATGKVSLTALHKAEYEALVKDNSTFEKSKVSNEMRIYKNNVDALTSGKVGLKSVKELYNLDADVLTHYTAIAKRAE